MNEWNTLNGGQIMRENPMIKNNMNAHKLQISIFNAIFSLQAVLISFTLMIRLRMNSGMQQVKSPEQQIHCLR